MAQYEEYFSALAGKVIQSDYLFQEQNPDHRYQYVYGGPNDYDHNGVVEYRGGPIALGPANLAGGTITAVDVDTGLFSMGGQTFQFVGASDNGEQLLFRPADQGQFTTIDGQEYYTGANLFAISNTGAELTETTIYDTHNTYDGSSPLCFAAGTLIQTRRGEIAVEHLDVGDRLLSVSGDEHPVVWLGWSTTLVGAANRPVVIRAGAFPDGSPVCDLRVTAGHALRVGEVLIPAGLLVNGSSIAWDDAVRRMTVFHVATDRHIVLFANGAAAESYRDDGNRVAFAAERGTLGASRSMPTCLPVATRGPVVARARDRLAAASARRAADATALAGRARS